MKEHFFQCPNCWEEISVLVDPSIGTQSYIEDCEICCNPIQISLNIEEGELLSFEAESVK